MNRPAHIKAYKTLGSFTIIKAKKRSRTRKSKYKKAISMNAMELADNRQDNKTKKPNYI